MLEILLVAFAQTPISDQQQLAAINDDLAGDYYLTQDIELRGNWAPLGPTDHSQFTGAFDGRGHTISGLRIDVEFEHFQGLFGYTDGATVHRLHLDGEINAVANYVGLLAGEATDSRFIDCHVTGSVLGFYRSGMLIGNAEYTDVLWCSAQGTLDSLIGPGGGLVGRMVFGELAYSSFGGDIESHSGPNVGGLAGIVQGTGTTIHDCVALGSIAGIAGDPCQQMGGLAANMVVPTNIHRCLSVVTLDNFVDGGAMAGYTGNTVDVKRSFYNIDLFDGDPCGAGDCDGEGMSTAQLQNPATYAGWDAESVWLIRTGVYPTLRRYCPFDIDRDGLVEIDDALLLLEDWTTIEEFLGLLFTWGPCEQG